MSTQTAAVLIAAIALAGYIVGAPTPSAEPQSKRSATPPPSQKPSLSRQPRAARADPLTLNQRVRRLGADP